MPLIKTVAELRKHLPVTATSSDVNLPQFNGVEERFLRPILGDMLLDRLQAAYDASNMQDRDTRLLSRCQAVIAPLAYKENLALMQTRLTDNGVIALEAENQRKAFKWEYLETKAALEDRGYDAQEVLIRFLRTNMADYEEWKTAPYNDLNNFSIIRSGADLTDLGMQHPQRTYSLVKPLFRIVEVLYIERALGANFYLALNDRLLQEQYNAEEKRLVKLLRPAVARWVMSVAADELHLRFGDNGFTVTDGRNRDSADEGRMAAGREQLKDFKNSMEKTASLFLSQAIDYLNQTASETIFPEYWASPKYVNPLTAKPARFENDTRRGFYVAG